jgi:uncharacterized protein (DUF2249 family)
MTTPASTAPVAPTDRVSDVIARDESLVDVFVRAAPHFSKLKNRAMRRVMARLITVEQAARTAGIPPEKLVRDLNSALGLGARADAAERARPAGEAARSDAGSASPAAAPIRPANAPVRELDVREDLRSGNEPFSKIMAAVAALGDDEVLRLRATFEPVPLFTVLGKRGFVHQSEEHGEEDWSVWFWRGAADAEGSDGSKSGASPSAPTARPDEQGAPIAAGLEGIPVDDTTLVLDVRGLEPPEPLMRTLTALETLPEGHQLLQVNARVPQFLFPMLVERGFACEVDESHADRVLVRIWRPA